MIRTLSKDEVKAFKDNAKNFSYLFKKSDYVGGEWVKPIMENNMKDKNKKVVSVRIEKEVWKKLKAHCANNCMTIKKWMIENINKIK